MLCSPAGKQLLAEHAKHIACQAGHVSCCMASCPLSPNSMSHLVMYQDAQSSAQFPMSSNCTGLLELRVPASRHVLQHVVTQHPQ